MVGLFRKDTSLRSRLLAEVVPFGVALVLGAFAGPFVGPWGGVPLVLVLWALLSFLLRRVRRRPWPRRVYRLAVLGHVVFWGALGWSSTALEGPGRPALIGTVAGAEAGELLAGYGEAAFELPVPTTVAGWGMRPRRLNLPALGGLGTLGHLSLDAMGARDAAGEAREPMFRRPAPGSESLGARALLLRARGGATVALVRLDLIVMEPDLPDAILERTTSLGLDRSTLVVAATHTHSAPGGVSRARLAQVVGTDHADPAVFAAVVDASVRALDRAAGTLRAAQLTIREARDVGENGRPLLARTRGALADADPSGEGARVDDRVLLLRVDGDDGRPIAVLLNYGVQPVVVRPRDAVFSRDLAGALEDAFQEALPGRPPVLFVNGHCGDVTPRREGREGPEGARALARPFAAAVAAQLERQPLARPWTRVRIDAASVAGAFGTPRAFAALGRGEDLYPAMEAGMFGRGPGDAVAAGLLLPLNLAIWSLTIREVRVGAAFSGAFGVLVNLEDHLPDAPHVVGAVRLSSEDDSRLLLWHPAVGTQALGKALRRRFGEPTPFLLGLAGGACGYLTTEEEYARGAYEARSSLYGPSGGALLEAALAEAVEAATPR